LAGLQPCPYPYPEEQKGWGRRGGGWSLLLGQRRRIEPEGGALLGQRLELWLVLGLALLGRSGDVVKHAASVKLMHIKPSGTDNGDLVPHQLVGVSAVHVEAEAIEYSTS
jgi:hypothetical protein